jgi:CRISPR-associated protein Cst2
MTLWTGGKQTNILSDISPKFIVFSFQTIKLPFLLEAVSCDVKGKVDAAKLLDSLSNYSTVTAQVIIGTTGVIDSSEIKAITRDDIQVLPIAEAFARVKNYLSKL